jgi:hypothetical protein
MNKRIKKKKINQAIKNIQTLILEENEFLVFRFDKEVWNVENIANFAEYIKNKVSNKVIFVPNDMQIIKVKD